MSAIEARTPIEPCPMCHGREFAARSTREAWVCVKCHPMPRDIDAVRHVVPEKESA